jgi:hypothetical protein
MNQAGYLQIGLDKISDYFIFHILNMKRELVTTHDSAILIARAHTYTIKQTADEEINETLNEVPPDVANRIRLCYDRQLRLRLAQAQSEFQKQLTLFGMHQQPVGNQSATTNTPPSTQQPFSPTDVVQTVQETVTTVVPPAQSTPDVEILHQRVSLEERKQLKGMKTTLEKIEALVRIEDERASGSLTGAAKTFASRFLKPAINCLKNHFNGNCNLFSEAYPKFNHTTFPELFCCGEGTTCQPKKS